ncbi:MAG: TonB-dependent receptor [Taibaiella sp.]|nr:TonB-dependent receptor [Taibaiella sp.]
MKLSGKKVIFFTLLFCLTSITTYAGFELKGKVTDSKGVPLFGASVEITDLKTGTLTDSNGEYMIENLPKGIFMMEVHNLGYATTTQSINIVDNSTKTFVLSTNIIEKNEVVVTGASLATGERRNITPVQSINVRQLRENASTNIIDAITMLPGVTSVSTGPAVSKPVIRGLGYNRIITLNNGVRQEGQQWGDEHGIEIDEYNVTRVEVLKGPASLAYGADGLAGVINIISNPDVPEGKILGNIISNYQTNSGLVAGHANIGGKSKGLTWYGYVTKKAAHDYSNVNDGYVFNSRFRNTDYGASVGVNKSWGSSKISFTGFNQLLGLPEGERDSATGRFLKEIPDTTEIVTDAMGRSYAMNVPYQHIQHYKWVWDNNLYLHNGGRIGLTIGYQRNIRQEFADPATLDVPGLSLLLQTLTYDLKYILPQKNDWRISAGINGMSQWNTNKGTEFLVPDYRMFDGGLYSIAKKDWDKWSVSGGLRLDVRILGTYMKLDNAFLQPKVFVTYQVFYPFTDYFTNASGSLGAAYNISKRATMKFNFSTGYRTPNIAELAANGVHEGTIRYEYGNVELKPEKSAQIDLGFSWQSEHLLVNVSLFDNYINKFIYIRKLLTQSGTDSIPTFNNDANFAAYIQDQANANLYGGEINIDYHPHPLDWLHLENTFSYVRGFFLTKVENTNNLPYMPPARWVMDLRGQRKAIGKYLKNGYAKLGMDMNFAQNNVFELYETETKAPGYLLFHAGAGADIINSKKRTVCTITLAVNNITDVAYQNSLSRLRYAPVNNTTGRQGIFNPGRNFSVMVAVPLSLK